jgi:thiosulfate dehydrogenase
MPWRGKNVVSEQPLARLDARRGEAAYRRQCAACHGTDGQGVQLEKVKPAPLWGSESWSDGAPFARVFVLAGYLRHAMPYWAPGSLDDATALDVALYLDTQERPEALGAKETGADAPYAQRSRDEAEPEPPRKARGKSKRAR